MKARLTKSSVINPPSTASSIRQACLGAIHFVDKCMFSAMVLYTLLIIEKIITEQIELDEQAKLLVTVIEKTYSFVTEARDIERVKSQEKILEKI